MLEQKLSSQAKGFKWNEAEWGKFSLCYVIAISIAIIDTSVYLLNIPLLADRATTIEG